MPEKMSRTCQETAVVVNVENRKTEMSIIKVERNGPKKLLDILQLNFIYSL